MQADVAQLVEQPIRKTRKQPLGYRSSLVKPQVSYSPLSTVFRGCNAMENTISLLNQ